MLTLSSSESGESAIMKSAFANSSMLRHLRFVLPLRACLQGQGPIPIERFVVTEALCELDWLRGTKHAESQYRNRRTLHVLQILDRFCRINSIGSHIARLSSVPSSLNAATTSLAVSSVPPRVSRRGTRVAAVDEGGWLYVTVIFMDGLLYMVVSGGPRRPMHRSICSFSTDVLLGVHWSEVCPMMRLRPLAYT